jgi:succinyl-diaminopimelate desuccinylase
MLTTQQFTTQLRKLVSFQTLTDSLAENRAALDYVETLLDSKSIVRRVKNRSAEILLASNSTTMTPEFGYLVHIDVVAGSIDMFSMQEKNGRLYGRGVSDMKFSIPLGVALLNEFIATKSRTTFCLAITTDEEIGGYDGGAYLAKELRWRPKTLIVPDGGDNLIFVDRAKGVCQLTITSTGTSSHASRPWDGKNAIIPLAQLVTELEKKYGENNKVEGWKTTLNIGKFIGGISTNQVCDRAVLSLDFRYPEIDSIEHIREQVQELTNNIDPSMQVAFGSTGLPTYTDVRETIVQRFLTCMESTVGRPINIRPTYGASDARHFAYENIPVLMIKPIGGDIHCETEWIDVQSTMDFYQGLRLFLQLK